jgi:hypothetical protein
MLRKKFLEDHNLLYGLSSYQYIEDYALWSTMYKYNAKFSNYNDFLFYYRVSSSSYSQVHHTEVLKETATLSKCFIAENLNKLQYSIKELNTTNLSKNEKDLIISLMISNARLFDISLIKMTFKKVGYLKVLCKTIQIILSKIL